MKIGIDCRFAGMQVGLGRYAREVVYQLINRKEADGIEYTLFVRNPDEPWLDSIRSQVNITPAPFAHYSLAEQRSFPSVINNSDIDLFFALHFNVPFGCKKPFVVTIHDFILHTLPNKASFLKQQVYRAVMKHAVRKSKHIITISNFVKDEAVRLYGEGVASKITAVYEGVDPVFCPKSAFSTDQIRKEHNLDKDFFLYVGNCKQHKNVDVLIQAFTQLDDSSKELVLVTGGKEFEALTLPDGVRAIHSVSDNDLAQLYSCAIALCTASSYEGFCLPVAEAQQCGCRVLAANTSAIVEIANNEALLVEPTVEAFTKGMQDIQSKPKPSPTLLSWEDTAKNTAEILNQYC